MAMTTAAIREKLVAYLQTADEKKVKAIYTMVEDEINTTENYWDDDFLKDLENRRRQFTNGLAKTYSWKETKLAANERIISNK